MVAVVVAMELIQEGMMRVVVYSMEAVLVEPAAPLVVEAADLLVQEQTQIAQVLQIQEEVVAEMATGPEQLVGRV
jgi:Ca2+/Na+ antiporter